MELVLGVRWRSYAAPCESHFKIRLVVSLGKRIGLFFATQCESHFKIRSVASSEKRFCHSFTTQCESHLKKMLSSVFGDAPNSDTVF